MVRLTVKLEVETKADHDSREASHDDREQNRQNEAVDVSLLVSELGGRQHGDDTCGVGQSIETDGGHSNQTVELRTGDTGCNEDIAEVLESNVFTGGSGTADTGANVGDQNDGECVNAEVHEAGNDVIEARNCSNDTAETGSAADSHKRHNCHRDSTSEESLDIHCLLLDDGEENETGNDTAGKGDNSGLLENVQNNDNNDHGEEASPQRLLVINGRLNELFLGDFGTGRHEAFASLMSALYLIVDVTETNDKSDDSGEDTKNRSCHGVGSEVFAGDDVLDLGRARKHTDGYSGGTEGGAGVQPPGKVEFLEQCACKGDNDEDGNENVNAAIGEDELNEGDGDCSKELSGKRILCFTCDTCNLNCDGCCCSGVAHNLCEQSAEQEDEEVALKESGYFGDECIAECGEGVQSAEDCNYDCTDDCCKDGVITFVSKQNESGETDNDSDDTNHNR